MSDSTVRMKRREAIGLAVAAGTVSPLVSLSAQAEGTESPSFRIVDTNVSLFQWPFRRLPLDEPETLIRKMRALGVSQAWAGSFEGLLHRDIGGVNERLMRVCDEHSELIPIGSVNPTLPDWEEDLRRCVEEYKMRGVRLHPNYHGYTLEDPRFAQLLKLATDSGRIVQIVSAMEDTRTQHPLLRVEDVDLGPLAAIMARTPGARVQVLNARLRPPLLDKLAQTPGIYFDTARVESTDGVPTLVQSVPAGRVLFGTHAPFLIPESALIRVHESGRLIEAALRGLLVNNADQLMGNAPA